MKNKSNFKSFALISTLLLLAIVTSSFIIPLITKSDRYQIILSKFTEKLIETILTEVEEAEGK